NDPVLRGRKEVAVFDGDVRRRRRIVEIIGERVIADHHHLSSPGSGAVGVSGAVFEVVVSGLVGTGAFGILPFSAGSSPLARRLPSASAAAICSSSASVAGAASRAALLTLPDRTNLPSPSLYFRVAS